MSSITYLHDGGTGPPPSKKPFVIVQGSFNLQLYDINSLLDFPLTNVRKMWKIMFSAAWENEQTIQQVRDWLPVAVAERKERIPLAEAELQQAKAAAAKKHSEAAVMGDGYWADQIKKLKRQQKAVAKGALSTIIASEIDRRLDAAIAQRDAPKIADHVVKEMQTRLKGANADYEKAVKLQALFTDMASAMMN